MAKETRPKDYPKLENYQPTRFILKIFVIPRVSGQEQGSGYYLGRSS